jgi:hypothetical protein
MRTFCTVFGLGVTTPLETRELAVCMVGRVMLATGVFFSLSQHFPESSIRKIFCGAQVGRVEVHSGDEPAGLAENFCRAYGLRDAETRVSLEALLRDQMAALDSQGPPGEPMAGESPAPGQGAADARPGADGLDDSLQQA